ncbi:MAG: cell division control protein 14 [Watsoniomyces obsoletus]|nr:MAG: cell division control protein 14 [Watsoniomyces obsoletus]
MSFGFSVSDIITATQLAYKIYGVVQTGRKDAPASFGEVSDALFGLHCALEHLSRQLPRMSPASGTAETNKIYQDLGVMIGGCSDTLQNLDRYLAKYNAFIAPAPPTNVPMRPGQIGRRKRLLTATTVEWRKIQWAKDEKTLLEMRQRLLGHTTTINMVVQTIQCHWMQEIHGVSQSMSEALTDLNKSWSNSESPQLLKEIHQMLSRPQHRPPDGPPPYVSMFSTSVPTFQTPLMNLATIPTPNPVPTTPKKPDIQDEKIAAVNQARTQIGKAALLLWQKSHPEGIESSIAAHFVTSITPASSVPPTNVPSGDSISDELPRITDPLSASHWIRHFEATIIKWETGAAPTAEENRVRLNWVIKEVQNLNRTLSGILARSSRIKCRARIEESDRLARTIDKVRAMLGYDSVRLQRAIDVYEDDKEEDEP